MLTINGLADAERFVTRQQALGNDVRWDGWNIVFFRPSPKGVYDRNGAFRDGRWGFDNVSPLEADGSWRVDWRNVRSGKRTHNTRH